MLSPSPACKYSLWFWLNLLTGERRPFFCKSWWCPDPAHRKALAWSWACKVARARPERMLTLTNIPKDQETARKAFSHLVRDLRDRKGIAFEYVRFFEVGAKTGVYHYHLGQRGDFVPVRLLSARARANGLGKIVDIRQTFGAGPGWYMSKYIAKGLDTLPAGWRKVAASRAFWPSTEPAEEVPTAWTLVKGPEGLKSSPGGLARPGNN